MKVTVDNKDYDTETAAKIARWYNGFPKPDFNHVVEELYLSEDGDWFLYCVGGASTPYADGPVVLPLSVGQVVDWLETRNAGDQAIAALGKQFGDGAAETVAALGMKFGAGAEAGEVKHEPI